jgi:hypothetical protein
MVGWAATGTPAPVRILCVSTFENKFGQPSQIVNRPRTHCFFVHDQRGTIRRRKKEKLMTNATDERRMRNAINQLDSVGEYGNRDYGNRTASFAPPNE